MGLWKQLKNRIKSTLSNIRRPKAAKTAKPRKNRKPRTSQFWAQWLPLPHISFAPFNHTNIAFPRLGQPSGETAQSQALEHNTHKNLESTNLPSTDLVAQTPSFLATKHEPISELWAYLDSFLKEQNSIHTKRAYEKDLQDFLSFLKFTVSAQQTNKTMTVHTIVAYRDYLQKRVHPKSGIALSRVSINRKIATVKSFLNWLVLNGVIAQNPARAIKSFRAGRESPTRDIPDDMVRRILSLPSKHTKAGALHSLILHFLFMLGLRRSECVDIRTSDIFEQAGMRVVRIRGKGDKERILPMPDPLCKALDYYLHITRKDLNLDQPLLTPVKNNVTKDFDKPLHPNAVAYIVKLYARKAGVDYRVSPHSARATAVSNALDHMASHRAVQHMAGWSSPLMVTRYDKRKSDLKNSAVRFVHYDHDATDNHNLQSKAQLKKVDLYSDDAFDDALDSTHSLDIPDSTDSTDSKDSSDVLDFSDYGHDAAYPPLNLLLKDTLKEP